MNTLTLLPRPQRLAYNAGSLALSGGKLIAIGSPDYLFSARRLQVALARIGLHWEIVADSPALPAGQIGARLGAGNARGAPEVTSDKVPYQLEIGPQLITLTGHGGPATIWYGVCTLVQILQQAGPTLPQLIIEDWPDFRRRGVMLDISRDKVPTMETLYALVDMLAGWKINEFQLYTEHTFAYRAHRLVWENASPLTGEEIMSLDAFCRERYIDLVPNQNSFGHMHRWLMHAPYRALAEVPEGLNWPLFITPRPFSISPAVPGSIALLASLYDELLPHFTSRYFNVGCDETFDLGEGQSRARVEEKGKGRVYLDFLKQIAAQVHKHGRVMQFWGDIINQYPDLVPELPGDVIALEWGYEADHPFDADGARFAAAGIPFYVCPGTSSWLSLLGRTENAIGNLRNAALNGKKRGAMGYLITDWGDYGHWQTLPVSYLGLAYGAAVAWAADANQELDLPRALDAFAFGDPAGVMGRLACDLGNAYRLSDEYPHYNGTHMARALYHPLESIRTRAWLPHMERPGLISPAKMRAAIAEIDRLEAQLEAACPADAGVIDDYRLGIALWRHGCKRILMAAEPEAYTKAEMARELRPLMAAFTARWMARNRPGGLGDSLTRMARLLAEYEASE